MSSPGVAIAGGICASAPSTRNAVAKISAVSKRGHAIVYPPLTFFVGQSKIRQSSGLARKCSAWVPMTKIAIVGATGPTGIHLVAELRGHTAAVRVIARDMDKVARLFPDAAVEKHPADILDADATLRAIEGCDLVYDCIGLPGDQMHLHPVTARNIAGALGQTKARCVQVSSYWAYYPQVRTEMNESHPRIGGPPWVRYRREAEDILCSAGAAILCVGLRRRWSRRPPERGPSPSDHCTRRGKRSERCRNADGIYRRLRGMGRTPGA
jgi:NAD(P)H-binding